MNTTERRTRFFALLLQALAAEVGFTVSDVEAALRTAGADRDSRGIAHQLTKGATAPTANELAAVLASAQLLGDDPAAPDFSRLAFAVARLAGGTFVPASSLGELPPLLTAMQSQEAGTELLGEVVRSYADQVVTAAEHARLRRLSTANVDAAVLVRRVIDAIVPREG